MSYIDDVVSPRVLMTLHQEAGTLFLVDAAGATQAFRLLNPGLSGKPFAY